MTSGLKMERTYSGKKIFKVRRKKKRKTK